MSNLRFVLLALCALPACRQAAREKTDEPRAIHAEVLDASDAGADADALAPGAPTHFASKDRPIVMADARGVWLNAEGRIFRSETAWVDVTPSVASVGKRFVLSWAKGDGAWATVWSKVTDEPDALDAVFATTDGGKHWRDATPAMTKRPVYGALAVYDATHAWVAAYPLPRPMWGSKETRPMTVFRTSDAGATYGRWDGIADNLNLGMGLDAVGEKHVLFWIHGVGCNGRCDGKMYQSSENAGVSWHTVNLKFTAGREVRFANAGFGVTGDTELVDTHDGGVTLRKIPLTMPAGYPQHRVLALPSFDQGGLEAAAVVEGRRSDDDTKNVLVVTRDGGKTWTTTLAPCTLATPKGDAVQVLSAHEGLSWWAWNGPMLCHTSDGATFTTPTPKTDEGNLIDFATAIAPISPQEAVIVYLDSRGDYAMVRTTDGGATLTHLLAPKELVVIR